MKIGYIRVSTVEQNIARQELIMAQLGVEKVFTDKSSGKNTDRPELSAMINFVRDGDCVIVESYSRLARSTADLLQIIEQLQAKNVCVISQKENLDTSTPQGKLMLTMFGALAQFERECMLQRQREGIAIAKAQGKYKGRPQREIGDFDMYYEMWKKDEITATAVCKKLEISRATFYRRVNILEDNELIDF